MRWEATAKTPAEHRILAAYYQQQAQMFNNKSAEQAAIAEAIAKGATPSDAKAALGNRVYISPSLYFAKQYAEKAKNAASLAAAHEEMATKAEQRTPDLKS